MRQMLMNRRKQVDFFFILTVVLPVSIALLYFGVIASDVYTSEARFIVRTPEKQAPSGLGMLLSSAGFSKSSDETAAVEEYIKSRDALAAVNENGLLSRAWTRPTVSVTNRFGSPFGGETREDLFSYYQGKVKVSRDSNSGVTTLIVRAFTPKDARAINRKLLELSENLVNQLSRRGRHDLINFAVADVNDAKAKSTQAALALSAYRNRAGVLDPERQATLQMQMVSKLQDELIASRTQLLQLRRLAPESPQIEALEVRVAGIANEINKEFGKVVGDEKSLAASAVRYQRLQLENQFADKQLASALVSLQDAQNEARRKQAYVERIAQPSLPDDASEPRRLRGVLATLVLGLVAYGVVRMLLAGMREHQL